MFLNLGIFLSLDVPVKKVKKTKSVSDAKHISSRLFAPLAHTAKTLKNCFKCLLADVSLVLRCLKLAPSRLLQN